MLVDAKNLKELSAYKEIKNLNKLDKYKGATAEVLKLVKLENKSFGTTIEKIIREKLELKEAKRETYDAIRYVSDREVKIEIKSSRIWGKGRILEEKLKYRFQHLTIVHKWDVLLLVRLLPNGLDCWIIKREDIEMLIDAKTIKTQGSEGGEQGYIFDFDDVKRYTKEIINFDDFDHFYKNPRRDLGDFQSTISFSQFFEGKNE